MICGSKLHSDHITQPTCAGTSHEAQEGRCWANASRLRNAAVFTGIVLNTVETFLRVVWIRLSSRCFVVASPYKGEGRAYPSPLKRNQGETHAQECVVNWEQSDREAGEKQERVNNKVRKGPSALCIACKMHNEPLLFIRQCISRNKMKTYSWLCSSQTVWMRLDSKTTELKCVSGHLSCSWLGWLVAHHLFLAR